MLTRSFLTRRPMSRRKLLWKLTSRPRLAPRRRHNLRYASRKARRRRVPALTLRRIRTPSSNRTTLSSQHACMPVSNPPIHTVTHALGLFSENFDLSANFPGGNMLVRNPAGDTVRSLYMVNDIVKSVVQHNDFARIRLMTCGTKVFGKQEGAEAKRDGVDSHFRVLAEGLPVVLPFVGPRAVAHADFAALRILMEGYYPLTSGFAEPFRSMIEAKGARVLRFATLPYPYSPPTLSPFCIPRPYRLSGTRVPSDPALLT